MHHLIWNDCWHTNTQPCQHRCSGSGVEGCYDGASAPVWRWGSVLNTIWIAGYSSLERRPWKGRSSSERRIKGKKIYKGKIKESVSSWAAVLKGFYIMSLFLILISSSALHQFRDYSSTGRAQVSFLHAPNIQTRLATISAVSFWLRVQKESAMLPGICSLLPVSSVPALQNSPEAPPVPGSLGAWGPTGRNDDTRNREAFSVEDFVFLWVVLLSYVLQQGWI